MKESKLVIESNCLIKILVFPFYLLIFLIYYCDSLFYRKSRLIIDYVQKDEQQKKGN